jgi:DNA-binding response OmpR family regulator
MDEPSAAKQEIPDGRLRLAGYTLDLGSGELLSPTLEVAPLRRQSLKVLLLLGSRAGQVVSREGSALEGSKERFIAAREDLFAALRDAGLE